MAVAAGVRARRPAAERVFVLYVAFAACFGVAAPLLLILGQGSRWHPQDFFVGPFPGADYIATYAAANSLTHGLSIYTDNRAFGTPFTDPGAAGVYSRYSYPPLQAFLLLPLAGLPFEQSYRAWVTISLALIGASCYVASMLLRERRRAFTALLLLYAPASFLVFQVERGQTDAMLLLFLTLFVYFYCRPVKNIYLSAAFFAAATLLKVIPGLFVLFFLIRREFKLVALSGVFATAIILLTGVPLWLTWLTEILPLYADYYLGMGVDHSLRYFFDGFGGLREYAVPLARWTTLALAGWYVLLAATNRHRDELVLLEVAILSVIMEIATPWSANYKLVVLVFLFLAPFAITRIPAVARHPVRYTAPLFLAFAFIAPIFGEYYVRLPYSLLANVLPVTFVAPNAADAFLVDRKVNLGLLGALAYLFGLYAFALASDRRSDQGRWARSVASWVLRHRRGFLVSGAGLLLICLVWITGTVAVRYARQVERYAALVTQFGPERPLNQSVALAGFAARSGEGKVGSFLLVYRSRAPQRQNLMVFVRATVLQEDGSSGPMVALSTFPSVVTPLWPADKYVVVVVPAYLGPGRYTMQTGFVDFATGRVYGEVDLGEQEIAPAVSPAIS